ncbi:MAG: NAD-dependent epimerase/dehydratase family protein [Halobacteria archaeon]
MSFTNDPLEICVTGAAGYIGSRVAKDFLEAGHDVVPVDDFSYGDVKEIEGVAVENLDVRDRSQLREVLDGVDAVCHLAAVSGVEECQEEWEHAFDVNVGGTENVAMHCREMDIPLVFPCSMAVIGDPSELPITSEHPRDPLNNYGLTKVMSENDIEELSSRGDEGFSAVTFMKSNLYGHHTLDGRSIGKSTVINIFVDRAIDGKPLSVHEPGTQARDFIHVKDVSRAYLDAVDYLLSNDGGGAETVPLASGECMSVLDLAELVQRVAEEELEEAPKIEMVENPRSGEAVSDDFTVDTDEAREKLGFETKFSVEDAVREMLDEAT